ncbi:hypothetical protein Dimus_010381 [Dionaea muscipula]
MAGIFKNIQGLYGLTTKKAVEEILVGTTDLEATQSNEPAPLQELRPEREGGDDEIVDLTVGHEHEVSTDDATSTEAVPIGGESDLPEFPFLDDDKPLKEFLIALNKLEVTNDEAAEEGVKDVASPQQKKRKLTKGGAPVVTESETAFVDKGKKGTATMAVIPVAGIQDEVGAEKEGRKTRGRGKTGDAKSGKIALPPSLQLPPLSLVAISHVNRSCSSYTIVQTPNLSFSQVEDHSST